MRVSPDKQGTVHQSSVEPNTVRVAPAHVANSGESPPAVDESVSSDLIAYASAEDNIAMYGEDKWKEGSGLADESDEYRGARDDEGGNDTWEYAFDHSDKLAKAAAEHCHVEDVSPWSADNNVGDSNYQASSDGYAYVDGVGNFIEQTEGTDGHDIKHMIEAESQEVHGEVTAANTQFRDERNEDGFNSNDNGAAGTWEYNNNHDTMATAAAEYCHVEDVSPWSADNNVGDPNYQASLDGSAYVDDTRNFTDWAEGTDGHGNTHTHEAESQESHGGDTPYIAEPNRCDSNVSNELDNYDLSNKQFDPETDVSTEPDFKPMVFEPKEGGPSVAEAHYAFEANGWSQGFSEEGHEYWTHNLTGETRWVAYMSEFLTQKQGEGLGEIGTADDFTETPWVPPRIDDAEAKGRESSFENSRSPLWGTDISSFGVWGSGVRLYFVFIRALSMIFAGMSLCYIPSILLMSSGNATSDSARDALGFWRYQLANIGAGEQADAGLFTDQIEFLGGLFYVSDVGLPLSLFTLLAGFVGLVGWFYLRSETTTVVNEYLHDVISLSDYSVFITNVPSDVSSEKLTKWLSTKFDLRGLDWKGRDKIGEVDDGGTTRGISHQSLYGLHHDCRVGTSAHLSGRQDNFILGSGLAEVVLVYSDGKAIGTFLANERRATEVQRIRSIAKMYGKGTLLSLGPDTEKRDIAMKRELELTFELQTIADDLENEGKLQSSDQNCIGALVVFNSTIAASRCCNDFKRPFFGKLPEELLFSQRKSSKPCAFKVARAQSPEDLLWENIDFLTRPNERRIRRVATGLVTVALLSLSLTLIGFMSALAQTVDEQLPDLGLCHLAAKVPFIAFNFSADMCFATERLRLTRPEHGSETRMRWDSLCEMTLKDSYFVVYVNSSLNAEDYLLDSSLSQVKYANVSIQSELMQACSTECPSLSNLKCPCVRVKNKDLSGCDLPQFDEGTCAPSTALGPVPLHASLHAACYCSELLADNLQSIGVHGLSESYRTDRDMCTKVFEVYSLQPLFALTVSVITFAVNKGLGFANDKFVRLEGHISKNGLELKLLISLFVAEIINTLLVPLLVGNNAYEDFIYIDETGRVERGWYADVGTPFMTTFIVLLLFNTATIVSRYTMFVKKIISTRKLFGSPALSSLAKTAPTPDSAPFTTPTYSMQADLDAVFQGPSFDVTARYTHALTLSFLALTLGPAIPLLFPMAAVAFAIIFWTDKFMLLRYHSRPTSKIDRQLQDRVNQLWAYGLILHFLFAVWIYGNDIIANTVEFPLFTVVETIFPFVRQKLSYDASVAPFLGAIIITVVVILLPAKALPGVQETLDQISCRPVAEAEATQEALFTEEYYKQMPAGYVLPAHEENAGWRYDSQKQLRYKVSPDGRTLKTWEVIRDNGLHTYYRDNNPVYREANRALAERVGLVLAEQNALEDNEASSSESSSSGEA